MLKYISFDQILSIGITDDHRFDRWLGTVLSGAAVLCQLVKFSISLRSLFMFCFARPFYFISGI